MCNVSDETLVEELKKFQKEVEGFRFHGKRCYVRFRIDAGAIVHDETTGVFDDPRKFPDLESETFQQLYSSRDPYHEFVLVVREGDNIYMAVARPPWQYFGPLPPGVPY